MRINASYKVLAVVLAVFVWFLARKSGEPIQMSFYAPVVFKNVSPEFQVTSDPPQVNIVVHTNSRDSFNPQEIQAVLDLDKAQEGILSYVLTENHILSPVKVEITRIHPSQITVRIEELIEKSFSIKPRYQGTPKKGYLLGDIKIVPDTLTMRGPRSVLEKMEHISAHEIELEGLNESTTMRVDLDLPGGNVQIIHQNVDFYTAEVTINSLPIKKRFDNVPVYLRNMDYVSVINPNTFNVFVEGPEYLIQELDRDKLYGEIDLSTYEPGNYPKVTPKVVTPEGITVLQQWPIVSVWVKNEKN
ncbi:MAG: CdaR family protein [SAR324 cluster bacterium]|jgi:YbbR domain-containing protein|nr:CdaR family protein [SAR324 cluster bacterium]MDP7437824.1 CdaR family protein [SAR324 cluster bacterium]MDP7615603.1 CdaR family protein [SAR324 cluster bacterium]